MSMRWHVPRRRPDALYLDVPIFFVHLEHVSVEIALFSFYLSSAWGGSSFSRARMS